MKKKKILVTVRQFKSNRTFINVDSRLFDGDTKKPIIIIEKDLKDIKYDYHLGQVSSNLRFAINDINEKNNSLCEELNKLYPQGYEFEFYYLKLYFVEEETKIWWEALDPKIKKKLILDYGEKLYGKDYKAIKPNKQEIEIFWQKNTMINSAFRILKPVNLNNIIE